MQTFASGRYQRYAIDNSLETRDTIGDTEG